MKPVIHPIGPEPQKLPEASGSLVPFTGVKGAAYGWPHMKRTACGLHKSAARTAPCWRSSTLCVHPHRVAGGHCHYCDPRVDVAARVEQGQNPRRERGLHEKQTAQRAVEKISVKMTGTLIACDRGNREIEPSASSLWTRSPVVSTRWECK